MAVARPAAIGQLAFVALAFAALAYAFLTNDFSVKNVASNSFSQLPPSTASRRPGLARGVDAAVGADARRLDRGADGAVAPPSAETRARVLGVLGLVSVGFLAFVVATSNPFERLLPRRRTAATSIRCCRTRG